MKAINLLAPPPSPPPSPAPSPAPSPSPVLTSPKSTRPRRAVAARDKQSDPYLSLVDRERINWQRRCTRWASSFSIDATRIRRRIKRCLQQSTLLQSAQELDTVAAELQQLSREIKKLAKQAPAE